MIASLDDRKPVEVRDHAMLLLMAVYGLRAGDVIALHLTDIDFVERILTVQRRKNIVTQRFPLNRDTVRTLRRYVNSARPVSECAAFFTTFVAPYEPLRHGTVFLRIRGLFIKNGVISVRRGPHALRHACADRLMKRGHSISEIAAFLGHANTNTVREYARFDHKALRKIADFSLKGLLLPHAEVNIWPAPKDCGHLPAEQSIAPLVCKICHTFAVHSIARWSQDGWSYEKTQHQIRSLLGSRQDVRHASCADHGSALLVLSDHRQLNEIVIPLPRMDLLSFFVYCGSHNELHHLYIVHDCFGREARGWQRQRGSAIPLESAGNGRQLPCRQLPLTRLQIPPKIRDKRANCAC
jgi:Phage integrase family